MKNLLIILLTMSNSVFASSLIGKYEVYRNFNVHQGTRAQELGFPLNPTLVSMKAFRENIFAVPSFEITYKTSDNSNLVVSRGTGEIISQDSHSAIIRLPLSQHGEFGGSCGTRDMKIFYVIFRIGLQGEFSNGHRFLGVHEKTNDNCHSPLEIEEISYTIDE